MLSSIIASQIVALLALASSVIAAPVVETADNVVDYAVWAAENGVATVVTDATIAARDGGIQKRSGALYACNDRYFQLNEGCVRLIVPIGICQNFPSAFVDKISSIGPDSDLICSLFDNSNCNTNQGYIFNLVSPGLDNLENFRDPSGKHFEDRIASYQCWRR